MNTNQLLRAMMRLAQALSIEPRSQRETSNGKLLKKLGQVLLRWLARARSRAREKMPRAAEYDGVRFESASMPPSRQE